LPADWVRNRRNSPRQRAVSAVACIDASITPTQATAC